MNGSLAESKAYFESLDVGGGATVVICPPFPLLQYCGEVARSVSTVQVGAQNCHWESSGAFTGEVSVKLLCELGVRWVLAGHSERRRIFGESSELISKKVRIALQSGLGVVVCIGEDLQERESGSTMQVLKHQITESLAGIVTKDVASGILLPNPEFPFDQSQLVIAYEPVWAIGTGKVADAEEVNSIHQNIKALFSFPVQVLYGGSCNDKNASSFASRSGIDGLLVGGASLNSHSFSRIVKAMSLQ